MSHQVRTHTRKAGGKTVTVRRHNAADPEAAARKRAAFERRVLRERQQAQTAQLRQRQQAEGTAPATTGRPARAAGERRARKKTGWTRAKSHAKKARRLWRRHKVRAAAHGLAALGWAAGYATRRGAAKARKTYRKWRAKRRGR